MNQQKNTTAWMQEVDRKLLLRFLHSPHPCGLATPSQGWSMDRSVADDCMDAGGRATQEQLPRTQMTLIVIVTLPPANPL